MSGPDLLIYGMCAGMILLGVVVFRRSPRDRPMGAIAIALGVIGLLAYLGAEEGPPPPEATPGGTPITVPVGPPTETPADPPLDQTPAGTPGT